MVRGENLYFDMLQGSMKSQEVDFKSKTVIHWFREDLRITDNTGLSMAIGKQRAENSKLITVFLVDRHDWIAHLDSNFRIKFLYNALRSLHKASAELSIPLCPGIRPEGTWVV